jgi:hypothetical protein
LSRKSGWRGHVERGSAGAGRREACAGIDRARPLRGACRFQAVGKDMADALQGLLLSWYGWLTFLHLFTLGVWAFSATGAYWLVAVAAAQRRRHAGTAQAGEYERRDEWARWHFNIVVRAEHIAFPLLLLTGLLLFVAGGWQVQGWLAWKLLIVLGIFLPMEIYDTWLSHVHVPAAMRAKTGDRALFRRALRRQDRFIAASMWIVVLLIPLVMWLASVKPG